MKYPRRIVCLSDESVETLYLLGEQDRIVGVSGFCSRPPEVRLKPRVSTGQHSHNRRAPRLAAISAVREKRIYEIPSSCILQPGPAALTDGLRMLHEKLAFAAHH